MLKTEVICLCFCYNQNVNPKTKLTNDQIKKICQSHSIPYKSHERITTGFSHELHKLNDDLVIKVYDPDFKRNFQTEAALLGSNIDFPKPKLIASGCLEDGRYYIIMSFVPGWSLGGRWHIATNEQRESLIEEISHALKTINTINPALINADKSQSWQLTMNKACNRLIDKLYAKHNIDGETAQKTRKAVNCYTKVLANDKQFVVFWDIHFDNFIVDDDFKLLAVIDLESPILTSLDYPIFVLEKMTHLPHRYLREDEEKYAVVNDYKNLKDLYRKYYPEMFDFENLDIRLKLYQLRDILHLLQYWSKNQENHHELARLIA